MRGVQIVGVAAGYDNVLQLGRGFNIGKGCVPATTGRLEGRFGDGGGVGTNGVGSGAEIAVCRTDRRGYIIPSTALDLSFLLFFLFGAEREKKERYLPKKSALSG